MSLRQTVSAFLHRKETKAYYWNIRTKAKTSRNPIAGKYYYEKHRRFMERNCAGIALGAEFASVPVFPHGVTGIFVSEGAKIGKECVIFHQVTIGSNMLPNSPGHGSPVIGDNVYIGCGAKIIGGVRVGNNVRIGANCVVTRDVPDNATVVLEKPRVLIREEAQDNTFVPFAQV
ncbi:MAG: serine acetyltransferase [Oscillospiraceae bacterium]|nr:serine acetyltransferase [Oscillospiraceae bacterium]